MNRFQPAIRLIAMDSLALTDWTSGDVSTYSIHNTIPSEMMLNQFEHLIPTPVATTWAVMIDLQKLILNSLLRRYKDTSNTPYETILRVALQSLQCQSQ